MAGSGSRKHRIAAALALATASGWVCAAPPASSPAPPASSTAAPATPVRDLPLGQRLDAELKAGESHRYRVALTAGRGALAVLDQRRIDIALSLRGPDGAEIAREDARSSGMEPLLAAVPATGPYEIFVTASSPRPAAGRYTLVVSAVALDGDRGDAYRHHAAGRRLAAGSRDEKLEARREFTAARASWEAAGEPAMAAYAAQEIGLLALGLQEIAAAREAFADAARRFGALGLAADQAVALKSGGEALLAGGDFLAASAAWKSVLPMESLLTPLDRVTLHYDVGSTAKELGEYEASIAALNAAIAAYHDLDMVSNELTARAELASVYVMQNDTVRSLEELTRGVALSRESARPDMEARFHQRLGVVYWEAGDNDTAAEEWSRALTLHRAAGNRIGEAAVLLSLGDFDSLEGRTAEAIAKYQQAYDILTELGSKQGQARALTRLGTALAKRGELVRAAEMQTRAVEINRAIGNKQGEVLALKNLAATKSRTGDRAAARDLLKSALAIDRELGGGIAGPEILADLALVYRDLGDTDNAIRLLDESLGESEAQQRRAMVPALQAGIGQDAQAAYVARIDILMGRHLASPRAGWDARALETAERARARALLSMLAEAHADIRKGVDPALLERYRSLQAEAAAASAAKAREDRLADLTSRIQTVEAEIRRASPAYAALVQPQPLGLATIRERVLDADTVLLEYALGEKRSWLWAVTRDEIVSAALPPGSEIESAAQKLYRDLIVRPSAEAARRTDDEAAALGRALLAPIAGRLEGPWRDKRLVIVPVGALQFVPFGVLPAPGRAGAASGPSARRLIEDHEVVELPSASVVDRLRRDRAGRPAAPRRLALFGDPVFGADDPRVTRADPGALPRPASSAASLTRSADAGPNGSAPAPAPSGASLPPIASADSASDPGSRASLAAAATKGFARLPFSREEVSSIASLLSPRDVLMATDFRASRALTTSDEIGGFQMLHFATHGLLDTAHPELSGLVLSQVDESGRPVDGFLRLQDIYNLHLGADLVVLSACRTALGRQIAGEGLVGLTRGFMYAGAPRVVASLWQVDDSATSVLMTAFYRGMLQEKLRPAAALRAAQRRVAADPRWTAPFYWAGFTLQGDWR